MRPRTRRTIRAVGVVLLAALGAATDPARALPVGALELAPCPAGGGYCGEIERPLDPLGTVPGTVTVHFEFFPHTAPGHAAGTLVATEGGPGYPATESRDAYRTLFAPLAGDQDVLIMDNRGTGRSGAIDCGRLQHADSWSPEDIGACGRSLAARAPLYSTALAAEDLAALLTALAIDRIDLYGDSYGTFFAQEFAVRHPERLRSLTLDGAYPLAGEGLAWWPNYAPAMREKFNRACARAPGCAALPGDSIAHVQAVLEALRARPFAATATDYDGRVHHFTARAGVLATVMFGAAPAYATLRETDAAARAFLAGDRLPLLRLMAESLAATDSRDATRDPRAFSAGLAAAVTCTDAPQIFDMRLPVAERRAARERALAAHAHDAPDAYAPFTQDEFREMPPDYAFLDQCIDWPVVDAAHAALVRITPPGGFPDVPVLVLSGELDNMTPVADGALAAAQFPHARHVVIGNGWHVNALPHSRGTCGARIVRAFIAAPGEDERALVAAAGCEATAAPLRLAPAFVTEFHHSAPARQTGGRTSTAEERAAIGAAVATLGDLLPRLLANDSGRGTGLRGGRYTVTADPDGRLHARYAGLRWTEDLGISGTVSWHPTRGSAEARLRFHGRSGPAGRLDVRWEEGTPLAEAQIVGTVDGGRFLGQSPAP